MYVCLCNGVTDRDIKRCISEGASSLQDLHQQLGVASRCGQCRCLAEEILSESRPLNTFSSLPYAAA